MAIHRRLQMMYCVFHFRHLYLCHVPSFLSPWLSFTVDTCRKINFAFSIDILPFSIQCEFKLHVSTYNCCLKEKGWAWSLILKFFSICFKRWYHSWKKILSTWIEIFLDEQILFIYAAKKYSCPMDGVLIRVGACEFYLWFYLFCLFNNQLFIEYLLCTRNLARN